MSDLVYTVGRILLSVIFIVSGFGKFMALGATGAYFNRIGVPFPNIMAIIVAVVELGGGILLLAGFQTRWIALALFVFTGVTIYFGHRFWAVPADQYQAQLNNALKNIAIMGGMLLLFANGGGRFSFDRRMRAGR